MPRAVCVGDLMVDVVAHLPTALAVGSDTPAPVAFRGGGAAANVAAWLASAGTASAFVGCVGADAAGREAVDGLRAAEVSVTVVTDAERSTGCCVVLVDPSGERTMIPSAGANAGLGGADAAALLPADAELLYLSGYALLSPHARPFALASLSLARDRGWPVAVDVASAAPLAAAGPGVVSEWLGTGLLVFANDDEARVLTGCDGPAAAALLADRFGEAVVKCGAAGAVWAGQGGPVALPARRVGVVDTVGAGDAFAAGFLHARLSGAAPPDCLRGGLDLAARAVAVSGGRPARGPSGANERSR